LTVWFNAWQYERENEFALIPLLRTIANKIPDEKRYDDFKKSIKKGTSLVKKHLPQIATSVISDLMTKFVGTKTGEEVKDISEQLIPKIETLIYQLETESVFYDGIENIANEIIKLREKVSSFRLVVFIDDLDRCSPDKTLEVLESIKLFLGLDGFIYVLGLSHETLSKLISQKYLGIKGEEYIKKMIQVPIHLPKWDKGDILKLITNLMMNNLVNPKYENIIEENKILISEIVEPNPRELKRFINNFTSICDVFNSTHNKIIPIQLLLIQALSATKNRRT
jgi:predicted KAP-like P-loop ATPase